MKRLRRAKRSGVSASYHLMSRTVGGEFLFEDRDKEVLRKMIRQVADFCGVEVLTYCILSNHFHVLVHVPYVDSVSDAELLRRFKVLYPKPTKYQVVPFAEIERLLKAGGEEASAVRQKLLVRMADISEYMKTLKQRFSVWYNRHHDRYGTLWADRFKSVLVEGQGNPLQTMAAYIDLNAVRAGLVLDPKDYRFCGYAEAVAGSAEARKGLLAVWGNSGAQCVESALRAHRSLIFGKQASEPGLADRSRAQALKVLEAVGELPKSELLRCRVRYFTDGAILGSAEFVRGFSQTWQLERGRAYPPKMHTLRGGDWGGLAIVRGLRRQVFG